MNLKLQFFWPWYFIEENKKNSLTILRNKTFRAINGQILPQARGNKVYKEGATDFYGDLTTTRNSVVNAHKDQLLIFY